MLILIGIIGGYKDMFNCYDIVGFKVLDLDSGSVIDISKSDDIENLDIIGLDKILEYNTYAFEYSCKVARDCVYFGKLPIFDESGKLIKIVGVLNKLRVELKLDLAPISLLVDLMDFTYQLSLFDFTDDCKKLCATYRAVDEYENYIEYKLLTWDLRLSNYLKRIYNYKDYGNRCYSLGSIAVVDELSDSGIVLDNSIRILYFLNRGYRNGSSKTVDIVITDRVEIIDVYTPEFNINRYNMFISKHISLETLVKFILRFNQHSYGCYMVILKEYWKALDANEKKLYIIKSKIITHKLEAGIYKDLESLVSDIKQLGFNITLY
jgi:hypothetical protein